MDALIDVCIRLFGYLLFNFFGVGLVCLLTAMYGAGIDWPGLVDAALLLGAASCWFVSGRGRVRLWRESAR
ncbi:hypothetical protein [Deinococcus yavapaiensis]|uniref:Uncharacterized protein n=1 Tax=Deinococcus yavapaiensis KR-236 TaxID=694435 RepID=A0A318SK73_9DEIO|nr:hypothetical protein [Deinococcus yavapaiensis]PYE54759.1 hypothetical protein DES52_10429 [Deinococcus yavapaiensis KR-236]